MRGRPPARHPFSEPAVDNPQMLDATPRQRKPIAPVVLGDTILYRFPRIFRIDRLQAGERHDVPLAVDLAPVTGGLPLLGGGGRKTVHQPERRRRVAAVRHESDPLGIGDEVARQTNRAHQCAVDRLFIVEMKAVAGVAD